MQRQLQSPQTSPQTKQWTNADVLAESPTRPLQIIQFNTRPAVVVEPRDYTLKEASSRLGISRHTLNAALAEKGRLRMIPSRLIGRKRIVESSVLQQLLDETAGMPISMVTVDEFARGLGITKTTFYNHIIYQDGKQFFSYETEGGTRVALPIFKRIGSNSSFLEAEAFEFVKAEERKKKQRMGWEDALEYLTELGVDVIGSQLLSRSFMRNSDDLTLSYPMLDGSSIVFEGRRVREAGSKNARIVYSHSDILKLGCAILAEGKRWVLYKEFLEAHGRGVFFGEVEKGMTFTLDGKTHHIQVRKRGGRAYIEKAAGEAYLSGQELKGSLAYAGLYQLMAGFDTETTVRRCSALDQARRKVHGRNAFMIAPLYGIAVPVREYNDIEKIHIENKGLVQLYLTLHTSCVQAISKAIGKINTQLMQTPIPIESILALWVIRSFFMQLHNADPRLLHIDSYFDGSSRALEVMGINLDEVESYCEEKGKPILFDIPWSAQKTMEATTFQSQKTD